MDLDKLNSFLDAASQTIACDADCENARTTESLKDAYLAAESNLVLAEPQYEHARQNYYTHVAGKSGYDDMVEEELQAVAEARAKEFKTAYATELEKIAAQLDTYTGIHANARNVADLHAKYRAENAALAAELKTDANAILTNDRKTFYEEQQFDQLDKAYFALLGIYGLAVCFAALATAMHRHTLSGKTMLAIVAGMVALPFVAPWILVRALAVLSFAVSLLPKNVYVQEQPAAQPTMTP